MCNNKTDSKNKTTYKSMKANLLSILLALLQFLQRLA